MTMAGLSTPLRVLHVEDNLADADLVGIMIADEWPGCLITRVETRDTFLKATSDGRYNLILSDFSMPQFDGLSALALARETDQVTPFIFFSGAIGEERAIEALKRGATDYVIKDRPARLVPAIRQALARVEETERRRRAEEELREQASLLDKARDAIFATDVSHRIAYWNASAERLYGWKASEVFGRELPRLNLGHDSETLAEARAILFKSGEWRGEFRVRTKSGDLVQVESTWSLVLDSGGLPRSILYIDTDVTEKRQLETQLLRADRVDSIGMLTGGVAHDLNNVFTPILMGADLLRLSLSNPKDLRIIDNIETSAQHGTALVRQLTSFARGGEGERSEVQIAPLALDVKKLLRHSLPSDVELCIDCAETAWPIEADTTQIKQLLLNLCLNARDAMPDGGRITIRARNMTVEAALAGRHTGARMGPHLLLEVSDSGTGIPPEIQERIFAPFFTTKGIGKGTGLGLPTVAGIVKNHGGFVTLESELGRGSTFQLHLPALIREQPPASRSTSPFALRGHGETILLLDDDPTVRETFRLLLERVGYLAIAATDGVTGVAAFQRQADAIAVVVTDMMMPGLPGSDVIAAIRALRPGQPIVAISGWIEPAGLDALRALQPPVAFLPKPVTAESLLLALRRALPQRAHERS